MCLIAIAWQASERFPLVIAGNRDEFLARPTQPLDVWHSAKGTSILGGRDVQDGGTWMGFTPAGRFAMLTNVRNPYFKPPAQPISRGRLVVDWLDSSSDAFAWAKPLNASQFNGFNLITGDTSRSECTYLSHPAFLQKNHASADIKSSKVAAEFVASTLASGSIHGLSNASLDTPWPKTEQLKSSLLAAMQLPSLQAITETLLRALSDSRPALDAKLPDTGVPLELERALSSAFVSHPSNQPAYGTRTSWVAVAQRDAPGSKQGLLVVTEITHSHQGASPSMRRQTMPWPM